MGRTGIIAAVAGVGAIGVLVAMRVADAPPSEGRGSRGGPAAVEVADVERGPIELRRTFSGTVEARSRFVVSASVGGRVEQLKVDLADEVTQGQVVAELDGAEEAQGAAEAAARVAVARANVANAQSALQIADREARRVKGLGERGLMSEADVDNAQARHLSSTTAVKVAKAELEQAIAAHRRSRIRANYTSVIAAWTGDDPTRVVAERHVAEGDTVRANDPLVTVVALDPLHAVVHVTESDYGKLKQGQHAAIVTDAYPDQTFAGTVARIAPVFRESSRQARVELAIDNPNRTLKPGMFVRAEIVLDRVEHATVVPLAALAQRGDETGLFVLTPDRDRVSWRPVRVGIQHGERVQVIGDGIEGSVVTLGQQLIEDGAAVTIPSQAPPAEAL